MKVGAALPATASTTGQELVYSGGEDLSTSLNDGFETVSAGGISYYAVANTYEGHASRLTISGGQTYYTTVNSGSYEIVGDGGSAYGTTVNDGGGLNDYYEGNDSYTTVNAGGSETLGAECNSFYGHDLRTATDFRRARPITPRSMVSRS